jgi:phosphosulfolactate synthase (CoM biosynthesis protein A)
MKDIYKIRKEEWIILRLMYLILSLDPTMSKLSDIQKTIRYIEKRHKYSNAGFVVRALDLIKKEHGKLNTFNDVEVLSMREMQKTVDVHREYIDEESREFMQRRVFGLSKQQYSSGVIQDIVDKINLNMGEKK